MLASELSSELSQIPITTDSTLQMLTADFPLGGPMDDTFDDDKSPFRFPLIRFSSLGKSDSDSSASTSEKSE